MNIIHKLLILLAVLSFSPTIPAAHLVGDTQNKSQGPALIKALQQGGYIVYFRHSATQKTGEKYVPPDQLKNCDIQRNLSPEGIDQSIKIGQVIKAEGIPFGDVYSSPYCRCRDTAQNIFGKSTATDSLYFAIHLDVEGRAAVTNALRDMLAAMPASGTNNAIVSHTANLKEAVNIWPKREGEAHIFKPDGQGEFSYIGRILPEEWAQWSLRN